jgi:hypothetical protein
MREIGQLNGTKGAEACPPMLSIGFSKRAYLELILVCRASQIAL